MRYSITLPALFALLLLTGCELKNSDPVVTDAQKGNAHAQYLLGVRYYNGSECYL